MKSMGIKLEMPLFYLSPFGLRFEIGPPEPGAWLSLEPFVYNENYFDIALQRATAIVDSAFESTDQISVVLQIHSDGRRKIHKTNYLFRQIKDIHSRTIKFSTHRDLYAEDVESRRDCWRRVTISELQTQDLACQNVLHSIINQDFAGRKPLLRGQLFLINHDKEIVLNLYDDRGMDVVASSRKPLELLYQKHNAWILDRNRKQIDDLFNP